MVEIHNLLLLILNKFNTINDATFSLTAPFFFKIDKGILRIKFFIDEEVCRGEFTPKTDHVGFNNITHGGIIFSLLDDVMANWLFLKNQAAHTAKCELRYRNPLPIGEKVLLEGRCVK